MTHYVEWDAYVGPPWSDPNDAHHWDWSALNAGAAYTPATAIPATTLASTLAAGATSAVLANATGWPSAGSAFVGPGNGTEAWERISWTGKSTNTLTGVSRETVDSEQPGTHQAGAAVRFWWPLATNDGALHVARQFDERMVLVDWWLELAGVRFPQVALRNNNLVLVRWRWDTGAWQIACVGFLDAPQARDDARRLAEWRVRAVSALGLQGDVDAVGVKVGPVDLAELGSVSASSTLPVARLEAHSGDYSGEPTFAATQVLDGDKSTFWIASRYLGGDNTPNDPGTNYDGFTQRLISQVHINPYVGQGNGYRWIEITYFTTGTVSGDWLVAQDGYYVDLETLEVSVEPGDHVILAENPSLFAEENPDHDAVTVVDLAAYALYSGADTGSYVNTGLNGTHIFDHLAPAGGSLRLLYAPVSQGRSQMVWGTGSPTGGWVPEWRTSGGGTSSNVPAPGPGETMRYLYSPSSPTEAADYWTTGHVATPGYDLTPSDVAWLLVSLPRLGLQLGEDLDSGSHGNGDTLAIADASGEGTTDGLDASGTLQIGSEQVGYSSKADGGVVLTGGVSGTYPAGTPVYLVDGGVATDARKVEEVTLALPSDVSAVIEDYTVRGSKLSTARTPAQDSYLVDYASTPATATGNTGTTITIPVSPAQRLRWLLLEITAMSVSPHRPRLATVQVDEDLSTHGDETLTSGDAADVVNALVREAGVPAAARIDNGDTLSVADVATPPDALRLVLSEFAEMTGSRVVAGLDSKVTTKRDPFWPAGTLPGADYTWDEEDLATFEKVWQPGRTVRQVQLSWRNSDNTDSGIESYPAGAFASGILHVGPHIFVNAANAQTAARRRYWMARRPYTLVVELWDQNHDLTPGDVVQASWPLADEMQDVDRTYLVVSVNQQIDEFACVTVVQLVQISREDER